MVFFFSKVSEKGGLFLYLESTDGLPLIHESAGAGMSKLSSVWE